jgi:hypothetical protein
VTDFDEIKGSQDVEFGIEVVVEVWDASEGGSIGWATEKGRSRSLVLRVLLARLWSAVQCRGLAEWMCVCEFVDDNRSLSGYSSLLEFSSIFSMLIIIVARSRRRHHAQWIDL